MLNLNRIITRLSSTSFGASARLWNEAALGLKDGIYVTPKNETKSLMNSRVFSAKSGGIGGNEGGGDWGSSSKGGAPFGETHSDDYGFGSASTWSSGWTKEHFDGQAVGQQVTPGDGREKAVSDHSSHELMLSEFDAKMAELEAASKDGKSFVDGWNERMREMSVLLRQVREPGSRGSYLKESEKAEMYRLHKENPEVYTVEKLAKDYRIMRQRVHAILWLKELEEVEEKRLGHPLDDSVERLFDTCPEFFKSHDREFHVASLPYKPDFKVMPEGWDGTTRDPDEVHYEISKKEDEMLYQEFVLRMNFNKKKMAGEVMCHKYSRRRSADGWKLTVEKLGPRGKRGNSGGWKFVSLPDGSSRPLNELEKMFVKRETPRRRRKILP